jgi:hypothetical protein
MYHVARNQPVAYLIHKVPVPPLLELRIRARPRVTTTGRGDGKGSGGFDEAARDIVTRLQQQTKTMVRLSG